MQSGSGRGDSVAGTVGSVSCIGGLAAAPPKDRGPTGAGSQVQARGGAGPTPLPLHCHLCSPRLGAELEGDSLMGDRGLGSQPRCWMRREVRSQPGQVAGGGVARRGQRWGPPVCTQLGSDSGQALGPRWGSRATRRTRRCWGEAPAAAPGAGLRREEAVRRGHDGCCKRIPGPRPLIKVCVTVTMAAGHLSDSSPGAGVGAAPHWGRRARTRFWLL